MKQSGKTRSTIKRWAIVAFIGTIGFGSLNYVDNFFEISKNLDIYSTMFRELNIYYVDEPNPGELVKTSIDAMLESLDPYTVYIPESDIEDYRFMVSGEYGGIGAAITSDDGNILITEPYEGFPADKAGLIAGDCIIKVDGNSVVGKSTDDVSKVLKGQANTEVSLTIDRNGETLERTLSREEIKIPDVPYSGFVADKIGYAKLNSFTHTSSANVIKAFKELKEEGMEKFILDLRGNGGGLLNEAVNIVNIFVDRDQEVVSMKGRMKNANRTYKTINAALDADIPVVVLVDNGSASASEIVSGSLQDLDRAVVIGERTYGKGLVQQTRDLSYNAKLKVTIAKYYTPSGRCIQKLDYSHRNGDGGVEEVPDSLISRFTTRNGREVFDGRGVDPDMLIEQDPYSHITVALARERLIFHYATQYVRDNAEIKPAGEYKFTETDFTAFKTWLKDHEFDYTTGTEQLLEELKETAEEEKYMDGANAEYDALLAKLTPNKENDLEKFKEEVITLLENEIVTRYYYADGRVKHVLDSDPYVLEAIKVLNDKPAYDKVLSGPSGN